MELLVVISLITLLISLLMPSLGRAKEEARLSVCMNQQKQISYAHRMYGDDHQDMYPYGVPKPIDVINHPHNEPWGAGRGHGVPPQQQFYDLQYIKDTAVWICPSDPHPENYVWWDYTVHPDFTGGSSYMFSEDALFGVAWKERIALRFDRVWQPSTFGFMTDGWECPNGWTWQNVDPNDPSHTEWWHTRIDWSHTQRVSVLWGDGHVTAEKQTNISDRVRQHPLFNY